MDKYFAQRLTQSEGWVEYVKDIQNAIEDLESVIYGNEPLSDRDLLVKVTMIKTYKEMIQYPYNILNDRSDDINKEIEKFIEEET